MFNTWSLLSVSLGYFLKERRQTLGRLQILRVGGQLSPLDVDTLFERKSDLPPIRKLASSLRERAPSSDGVRYTGVWSTVGNREVTARPWGGRLRGPRGRTPCGQSVNVASERGDKPGTTRPRRGARTAASAVASCPPLAPTHSPFAHTAPRRTQRWRRTPAAQSSANFSSSCGVTRARPAVTPGSRRGHRTGCHRTAGGP